MFMAEIMGGQGWGGAAGVFAALITGFLLDVRVGDPAWLYRRVSHPVAILGAIGQGMEAWLNRGGPAGSFLGGMATLAVVCLAAGGAGVGIMALAVASGWGGVLVEGVFVWTLLSYGDLRDRIRDVSAGLGESLEAGRQAAGHVVGRDTSALDESEVSGAALESLGENFSDGVVGPLFWGVLFGLPGVAVYKAVNTMDSMFGYRGGRHEWFGKAMARMDDGMSYGPARVSAVVLGVSGVVLGRGWGGFAVSWRDGGKHESVNAGWPEGAMAGVLGVALGGRRVYGGRVVEGARIGSGRKALRRGDIDAGLRVYRVSGWVVLAALAGGWVMVGAGGG